MFNAEKLLGGMLTQSLGKSLPGGNLLSSKGSMGTKAAVGMGILGVAFAAAEHYLGDRKSAAPAAAPRTMATPPPATPMATPNPSRMPAAPPPPPPMTASSPPQQEDAAQDAVAIACIRAMIAAAWADGSLDGDERAAILRGFEALDLSPEETAFLHRELATPLGIPEITASITTPDQAQAVYAAACMAIVADTPAEHAFLEALASALNIDPDTARELKRV